MTTRPSIDINESFIHIYKKGSKDSTLCLLHGTGGDENDLLPIASMIDADVNILSIRGNVNENGMNRFFRRISEGIFDEEDIIYQSKKIANFLQQSAENYDFDLKKTIFIGYSNGANIASSILLLHPDIIQYGILFRPMVPLIPKIKPDLQNHKIFISAGLHDTIIPPENTKKLITLFDSYHAKVTTIWTNSGHELQENDINEAQKWYQNNIYLYHK